MEATAKRNRAFVEGLYARYVAGDLDAVLGSLAEDAVWESEGSALPWSGRHIGQGARDYFAALAAACELRGFTVERVLADEEWVVVLCTVQLYLRAAGREATFRKVDTLRIEGDRILAFREYYDSGRLREALGAP